MNAISALVCTRNRPGPAAKVVDSLLASPEERIELVVIDQSDDDETQKSLEPRLHDSRLRYVRSASRGKGKALNEGLTAARGAIVVCTDDDCHVPPGWATAMANVLLAQPTAAVAFCSVVPVPHDADAGYVPAYHVRSPRLVRSVMQARNGLGLGAAMAVRRELVLALGGFDEAFGPGGRFPSADDWDISLRMLLSGHHLYETPDLEVLHDGFRTFAEGRAHARRDWMAIGALCAKPLRAGHFRAVVVPLWFFPTRALWPPAFDLLRLRKPRGLGRITAFVQGFLDGLRIPVEKSTLRFATEPK